MSKMNVVAVAQNTQIREALISQLKTCDFINVCGVAIELADANQMVQRFAPDLIIMDLTGREVDTCLFIEVINYQVTNKTLVFGLHREMDPQVIVKAVSSGVKEFIHYPADSQALNNALQKHWQFRQKVLQSQQQAEAAPKGKLIPVFGAKGGVGSTTTAVNLAHQLFQLTRQPVVLLDMDPLFGNTAVMLNAKPAYALSDLVNEDPREIDEELIRKVIYPHETGLDLLVCSRHVLEENAPLSEALIERVVQQLRHDYAYVIVDLPTHIVNETHQYFVGLGDDVLLVSAMEIASLYRSRQYIELIRHHMGSEIDKVKLVLNRYDVKAAVGMSNETLEAEFNYPVFCRLPNNWTLMTEAMSLGKTLEAVSPQADLVKGFQALAAELAGIQFEIPKPEKKVVQKTAGNLFQFFPKRMSAHVSS